MLILLAMAYGRALCLVCLVLISFTVLAWHTCHAIWGLLCLEMLTILCLYYIYYSCTYIACNTWCTCHTYGGFYFLKCLFYTLLYLYLFTSLEYLPCYMGLLSLGMLILCFTIFTMACTYISLGELVMLMGAFISWHAYLMPYYIYYNMYLPSLEYL